MEVIESKIDTKSEGYQRNYKWKTALVEDLNKELDMAMS